ncbi:RHS repeat-associated core domain-containing protein [Enterobacter hormaechei]|nr:RHS repeat-associated core domain-containing protein [Enterobacter hormaechei]
MVNKITRLIKCGHTCLGVSDDDRGVTLTAADRHDSPLQSLSHSQASGGPHVWSPYGGGEVANGLPGFNGERRDPFTGNHHLGNGYRAYSPRLMRFTCPDSLSPFGGGGINPYAYCAGDPVNITDPSGHAGMPDYFWGVMGAAFSILGLAAALLSGGWR